MAGALVEHLTTDSQMKLYRETVMTILEKYDMELDTDLEVMLYDTMKKRLFIIEASYILSSTFKDNI